MDGLSVVHFDMESIVSNIMTILENCQSIGDSLGLPMDVVSTVLDDTLDGISFFKSVKAMASIPDQLFFNKVERFLVGLDSVDDEQRRSFFAKNEEKLIEDFETTLNLNGESSEQVQRLVVVDLPGALPLETLAWSPVE